MNLDKKIKKKILETKEQKDRLLIEQKLVENRLLVIFESEDNIKNWDLLSEEKKLKISFKFLQEISHQHEVGLINEQFLDIIKSIFGSSVGGGFGQAILEPAVKWILSGIGMGGDSYMSKFVISFLTKKEGFWNYFKDCRTLSKGIAESLAEAVTMEFQQKTGTGGFWMDAIRNTLGDWISHTGFVEGIEKQIGDTICQYWDKATGNAKNVLNKLQGEKKAEDASKTPLPAAATTGSQAVFPTGK